MSDEIKSSELRELKNSVHRIEKALLGELGSDNVGLVEETRNLRKDVNDLKSKSIGYNTDIEDLKQFKKEIKKMVALVAAFIPFVFELGKGLVVLAWDFFKNIGHK